MNHIKKLLLISVFSTSAAISLPSTANEGTAETRRCIDKQITMENSDCRREKLTASTLSGIVRDCYKRIKAEDKNPFAFIEHLDYAHKNCEELLN